MPAGTTGVLHPQFVIKMMSEILKGDAVIVSEVGQNQMWTAQHFCFRHPRTWITSGGLGTMGYGFPAAIRGTLSPGRTCPSLTWPVMAASR